MSTSRYRDTCAENVASKGPSPNNKNNKNNSKKNVSSTEPSYPNPSVSAQLGGRFHFLGYAKRKIWSPSSTQLEKKNVHMKTYERTEMSPQLTSATNTKILLRYDLASQPTYYHIERDYHLILWIEKIRRFRFGHFARRRCRSL